MIKENLKITIPNENRVLAAQISYDPMIQNQQLVLMATGYNSTMRKWTQMEVACRYQEANFATLQFDFMGMGDSDGKLRDTTLSSSITDLTSVWNYATQKLGDKADVDHIAISANSYGALIALMAYERGCIFPESMVLTAPYSFNRIKPFVLPLNLIMKVIPDKVLEMLNVPFTSKMFDDFIKNHRHALEKKNLLDGTAVLFFLGKKDPLVSLKTVKKWCDESKFYTPRPETYNYGHGKLPKHVEIEIQTKAVNFIKLVAGGRQRSS